MIDIPLWTAILTRRLSPIDTLCPKLPSILTATEVEQTHSNSERVLNTTFRGIRDVNP